MIMYRCSVREDGTLISIYNQFTEDILQEIFETIQHEPAVFPFRFLFVPTNNFDPVMAQIFLLRHIRRYKFLISENFMILVKRNRRLRTMPHNLYIDCQSCRLIF